MEKLNRETVHSMSEHIRYLVHNNPGCTSNFIMEQTSSIPDDIRRIVLRAMVDSNEIIAVSDGSSLKLKYYPIKRMEILPPIPESIPRIRLTNQIDSLQAAVDEAHRALYSSCILNGVQFSIILGLGLFILFRVM